jgi:shikimate kinase
MKIVVLGYMASGKSSIGKALAKKLNVQFIDLDSFIEENEEQSISEIFNNKGEIYFRNKEEFYLKKLFNSEGNRVISLGGGTPCYGENIELILNESTSFYLKASVQIIFERLKKEALQRPLVATIGQDKLKEYIAKHLFERTVYYEKAHHCISVNDKEIDVIVEEIFNLLK